MRTFVLTLSMLTLLATTASAGEPGHPYSHWTGRVKTIDLAEGTPIVVEADDTPHTGMPGGWVQRGGMVLPRAIDDGTLVVDPESIFAVEDIPGNEYPRKHTLYLNFTGGELHSGSDNSAESKSQLAREGNYPAFAGGEAKAVSVAQGVEADFAPFGVQVVYLERPADKTLPYTMAMIGGDWTDTNIDTPAGGVAPGADCGALGQRHVVYAFESSSAVQMANTTSQEAGHAYGLDHTFNCDSVMSYCGGGDQSFQGTCEGLCESQCQGPNSAGCQLTHEMFCGEGSLQQNDVEEMTWLFGGNEPDMEAPTAEIVEPADGAMFEAPGEVQLRALVDDNYGGYGWRFVIEQDGEVIIDEVDYERKVDSEFRAALKLTGLPDGTYTARVVVLDHFGGVGEDEIQFVVGTGSATSADGTGDDGDDGDDGDGTAGDSADDDSGDDDDDDSGTDGTDTTDLDNDSDKRGCACASDPTPPGAAALFLFAVLGLRRRRETST